MLTHMAFKEALAALKRMGSINVVPTLCHLQSHLQSLLSSPRDHSNLSHYANISPSWTVFNACFTILLCPTVCLFTLWGLYIFRGFESNKDMEIRAIEQLILSGIGLHITRREDITLRGASLTYFSSSLERTCPDGDSSSLTSRSTW